MFCSELLCFDYCDRYIRRNHNVTANSRYQEKHIGGCKCRQRYHMKGPKLFLYYLHNSHDFPLNPVWHLHEAPRIRLMHVPPLWHTYRSQCWTTKITILQYWTVKWNMFLTKRIFDNEISVIKVFHMSILYRAYFWGLPSIICQCWSFLTVDIRGLTSTTWRMIDSFQKL